MKRFMAAIAHPVVWLGVILIVVNDLWLKAAYPSWLSGKLSDVGALVVAPLLLAGLLSLAMPAKTAGWLAVFGVGAGFTMLKLGALPGSLPIRSVADASDLLALPALALAVWLWFRVDSVATASQPARWKLLLIPLFALVLLGDAARPDYGIDCLQAVGGQIKAYNSYWAGFTSADGGLTWQASEQNESDVCEGPTEGESQTFQTADGQTAYRVTWSGAVEVTADGGAAWQTVNL